MAVILLSHAVFAQGFNGGQVSATSACAYRNQPASELVSVSAPSGGIAPYVYQWEAKIEYSNWTNVINNVGNGPNLSPGPLSYTTKYRRKVIDAQGAVAYSNEITIFLIDDFNAGRVYSASVDTVFALGEAMPLLLSNPATGGTGNYAYQWEMSSTGLSGQWMELTGETALSYQPQSLGGVGYAFFRKKATDISCGTSIYSNPIKIEVVNPLALSATYWTSRYMCFFENNQPSRLDGRSARGGQPPYAYQWEMKPEGSSVWTVINGATDVNYQPSVLSVSTAFRRKVTDAAGAFGYSNEESLIKVTTLPNPGVIGSNATLIAPNAPLNAAINIQSASNFYNGYYVWQASTNAGNTWNEIANYNYSTYFPDFQPTVTTCYRRAIREACATDSRDTYTNIVCIDPSMPLTDGTISLGSGNAACVGASQSPGAITGTPATGGATPYTYKWQSFDGTDWVDIASSNLVSYTPGPLNHDAKFRRIVTDANGTSLTSNEVIVTISSNASLKGGLIDGPIVTCTNTAPGIINNIIDACGGGGVFTYSWEASTNGGNWSAISGANQPTHNATSISNTTKYRRKVGDGCGNAVYSNEVEVFVYPAIEAGSITPANQVVCVNQYAEPLGLTQNCHYTNGNVTYQWQRANANGSWSNINGATQPVLVPRVITGTSYYRLVVKSSVCNAEAVTNVATVNFNNSCIVNRTGQGVATDGNGLASNLSGKGSLKLYPNPVSKGQTVFVTFDGDGASCKASLRGTDGRMFSCTVEAATKGSLQIKMPVNIAQGTYLIQLTNGQKQWVERIVIY